VLSSSVEGAAEAVQNARELSSNAPSETARRRDGAPIQARTEEQSPARVGISSRQKAPRSLRRCRPSRGGIQERPRPERRVPRDSRPRYESSRRQGCPKRHEEGTRESSIRIVEEARARLCSGASAHGLSRPREWKRSTQVVARRRRAARGHSVARRSPVRQRITRPTQPAPVGAGE